MAMTELFSLQDRVAVITGALGLLGKHHCQALARAGANVIVSDLDRDRCQMAARDLPTPSLGICLDVADSASVKAALCSVLARFGRVDVLVNNAAINEKFESPELAA